MHRSAMVARVRRMRVIRFLPALLALLATPASAADWPQTFSKDGNTLVAAQPQLDGWANRVDFTGRVGVVVTPAGGTATGGVLRIAARTDTDPRQSSVMLSDVTITDAQFPGATPELAAQATALAKTLLPASGLSLPLDYLLAALVQAGQSAASLQLPTTPPQIFMSEQPARLVLFDGAPSFAAVPGTSLQHAVNTNWPLLRTSDGPALYLLDSSGWLTSETLESGVWQYATQLPPAFNSLPATADWQDVRQSLGKVNPEGQPPLLVYVSTTPAELIVTVGSPQYQPVPGTGLYSVTNTDSVVFWDGYAKAFYYLVAGRWFRAAGLSGPWAYATGDLPADMASIPADGPLAAVLTSVPNTPEAREAALQAQIPRLATVSRSTTATVAYDGAPQFAPIDGTALAYAVNTGSDVIRVGDAYYLCQKGVWFTAAAPTGPWSVATSVPDAIYAIPPSAPLYNVTYVRLYQVADDQVVYGYTDGYLGEYVSDGVVTWGTGYVYPPYLGVGAVPVYYPRAYTYGADAFYDPRTGTFHRAGYGYGPYGGIAAGAAYDPATGTYARGAAVYGPAQSAAAGEAYNPRTGVGAAGVSRSNPYASWQQGVVYGPARAARGEEVSDDRGSVARVQTADGGEAVAVDDGRGEAEMVRSPGGNWYAGSDGRVYERGDQGWQRPPGLGRAVDAGGYAPSRDVGTGLDNEYALRQRQEMIGQRFSGDWGARGFGGMGGGRYAPSRYAPQSHYVPSHGGFGGRR